MMILMNKKIKIKFAELLDICNVAYLMKKTLAFSLKISYSKLSSIQLAETI